ncbi:MAG: choice-of-anchor D domain-containing protein [Pyrinomonadaceae bacterium]
MNDGRVSSAGAGVESVRAGACKSPLPSALMALALLALVQLACVLTTETIVTRPVYNDYVCRATLVDTSNGERRLVNSSMLARTAPGAPGRTFFDFDWDGDGMRGEEEDARLDWRRYLTASVVSSTSFAGRSWCVVPSETSCTRQSTIYFRDGVMPGPLSAAPPPDCTAATGARLEVSAPGLTPENQFAFPDTAVGDSSAPVTFTVTNVSMVSLRVAGVDFTGGRDAPDFVKTADGCLPTAAEMTAGRGHLLTAGGTCTFQLEFRPLHRDGVPECAAASPNESCRRSATLLVSGEVDASRSALSPVSVGVSGRATGGDLVTEPAEVCFPAAPALGACTPFQTLRIRNNGTGDLTLTSARLTRAANRFEATMPFLMSFTLSPGLPLDVPVRFCNVADDPTDGEFTINSSSAANPTTVVTLVNPLRRRCP